MNNHNTFDFELSVGSLSSLTPEALADQLDFVGQRMSGTLGVDQFIARHRFGYSILVTVRYPRSVTIDRARAALISAADVADVTVDGHRPRAANSAAIMDVDSRYEEAQPEQVYDALTDGQMISMYGSGVVYTGPVTFVGGRKMLGRHDIAELVTRQWRFELPSLGISLVS